jgi:hypothetical protein
MNIDALIQQLFETNGPVPVNMVEEYENEVGGRFPDDYRRFLVLTNGGLLGRSRSRHLTRFVFEGTTPYSRFMPINFAGFRPLSGTEVCSLLERRSMLQIEELEIPLSLVPIASDPWVSTLCIGIRDRFQGRMYSYNGDLGAPPAGWDGQVETAQHLTFLADSFTEFVEGLQVARDDG